MLTTTPLSNGDYNLNHGQFWFGSVVLKNTENKCSGFSWSFTELWKAHILSEIHTPVTTTPCPQKNYNTIYVAITLANNVGF